MPTHGYVKTFGNWENLKINKVIIAQLNWIPPAICYYIRELLLITRFHRNTKSFTNHWSDRVSSKL